MVIRAWREGLLVAQNFMERKAIKRVRKVLPLAADEEVLEFDICLPAVSILPAPFPFPVPGKRLDIVITDRSLYMHADRIVGRWNVADLIDIKTSEDGFIKGYFVNGENFSTHPGPGPRNVVGVARQLIERHESQLGPDEILRREGWRGEIADREEQKWREWWEKYGSKTKYLDPEVPRRHQERYDDFTRT